MADDDDMENVKDDDNYDVEHMEDEDGNGVEDVEDEDDDVVIDKPEGGVKPSIEQGIVAR